MNMETLLFGIQLFIFIFSCLLVIKDIFSFIKVLVIKQGKVEQSKYSLVCLGCAISYIITTLIIGF